MAGPTKTQLVNYFDGLASGTSKRVLLGQSISHQALQLRSSYEDYFLDLWTASGRFPAIMNLNWRRTSPTFSAANISTMTWLAIDHWKAGGIPQITAFFDNPWTGGGAGDTTRAAWALEDLVDDGEAVYSTWHSYLDDFADEFDVLAGEDVVFIFRPFHECTGSWFWWGPQATNEWAADQSRYIASFVAMWEDLHTYLNTTHGLSANIIWAYTTSNRDIGRGLDLMFPGSDYADIAGCSCYDEDGVLTSPGYSELQSLSVPIYFAERGRALGETGAWSNLTLWETHKADYPDMFAAVHWASTASNYLAIISNSDYVEYVNDSWAVCRGMVTPHELVCGITFEQDDTTSFDDTTLSGAGGELTSASPGLNSTSYKLQVQTSSDLQQPSYGTRYVQVYDEYADQLHAELYFDPDAITMDSLTVFTLTDSASTQILSVYMAQSGASYALIVYALDDADYQPSQTFTVGDAAHSIDIYLARATAAGASNGRMAVSIDGGATSTQYTSLGNFNHWDITQANMGDIDTADSACAFYLDELSIDRTTWYTAPTSAPYVRISGDVRVSGHIALAAG